LAAIMVVVHHLLTVIKGSSSHQSGPQWTGGTTGVDIFFVISGTLQERSCSVDFSALHLRTGR
jgi:peptidoglycan/LPS O-acetylase OafA/YrhL